MKVFVTGSTGLIGSALAPHLEAQGHQVLRLVRSKGLTENSALSWNPQTGDIDLSGLSRLDAGVHLAGENIAGGRWTRAKKARIRDSRIQGTRLLCEALARLEKPPRALVSASAVGYYGDRGDEVLDEASEPGSNFLAETCRAWEGATEAAERAGIRVVHLRFGVVLSSQGGALAKMLLPFRWGLGGRFGTGRQYMSWIALGDAVRAASHALTTEALRGPVNAVAPNPVTNRQFTKALGRVLHRPTVCTLPAPVALLVLGQMADELLLSGARAVPKRLLASGFEFRFPALEGALQHLLKR